MVENNKTIHINGKIIELEYTIRKYVEYKNGFAVLMYDETIIANNVIYFNDQGEEEWRINDILKIRKPTGNVDMVKENDDILCVYSTLGMVFKIDVKKKELIEKTFLR